jgi:hypothetical protein
VPMGRTDPLNRDRAFAGRGYPSRGPGSHPMSGAAVPFAHCPACAGPAVLDPPGRCPEGHLVGAAGVGPDGGTERGLTAPAWLGPTSPAVPITSLSLDRARTPAPASSPEEATDLDELASLVAAVQSLDDRGARAGDPGPASHATEDPSVPPSVEVAAAASGPHRTLAPRAGLAQALAEATAVMQPAAVTDGGGAPPPASAAGERTERHGRPASSAGRDGEPERSTGRPTDPTEPIAPVRPDVAPGATPPSIEDELAAFDAQVGAHSPHPREPGRGFDEFDLDDLDPTVEVPRGSARSASTPDVEPAPRAHPSHDGPRSGAAVPAEPAVPTPGPATVPALDGMNFTAKGGRVGRSDRGTRAKRGRRGSSRR